jgi:hypothetical protein
LEINEMEESLAAYLSFGGFFLFEIIATPYYLLEDGYYRAEIKQKKWFKKPRV